jgi:hypothetical protein
MTVSFTPNRHLGLRRRTIRLDHAESLSLLNESSTRLRRRKTAYAPASGEQPDLFGRVSTSAAHHDCFACPSYCGDDGEFLD